jgi:hypothetical protein
MHIIAVMAEKKAPKAKTIMVGKKGCCCEAEADFPGVGGRGGGRERAKQAASV